MISYEDLDLRITSDGEGFKVSAYRGPQSATEPLVLDLSRSWDLWQLGEGHSGIGREFRPLKQQGPGDSWKEIGSELFDALIRGKVRNLYNQGRGGIGTDASRGLRIRIVIDPRDERMRPLLRVPWEILYDRSSDSNHLPALDPRRPVVRTLESIEQPLLPAAGKLQRVLLALANPHSSDPLDLEAECSRVKDALERIQIRPEVVRQTTRSKLLERISDGEHQVIHFMGHGDLDTAAGEGMLLLEDEHGGPDPLRASTLAGFFAGKPAPRLVVLASCRSAEPTVNPAFGPFTSVAAALVAAGMPAVVAMQTAVYDRSAIRFTERLYRRLVKGDPIEAATAEARIALRAENFATFDWAVPVLFVLGRSGEIVGSDSESPQPLSSTEPAAPSSPTLTGHHHGDGGILIFGDVGTIYHGVKGKHK